MTSEISAKNIQNIPDKIKHPRIYIIDEVRGLAVIAMFLFHFMFSAGYVFDYRTAYYIFKMMTPIEPAIAVTFVFLSGVCTKLSRSNVKRGCILFAIALAVNIITEIFIPQFAIRFGVINLLSVCMILYGLCEKFLQKINPVAGLAISLVIFMLTWGVNFHYIGLFGAYELFRLPDFLYQSKYMFPLGFRDSEFSSGDYFPLFPWLFLFLSGGFFAQLFKGRTLPQTFYKVHSVLLSKAGKYSLVIYIAHQPLIFAVLYVLEYFTR